MHMDNILFQFRWCVLSGQTAGACELTLSVKHSDKYTHICTVR